MIKANVNVTGTIKNSASVKTDRNGVPYLSFLLSVTLQDPKAGNKEIPIYVSVPCGQQSELSLYTQGKRAIIGGDMDVKMRDNELVCNLTANLISTEGVADVDSISGTLDFRGHLRNDNVYEEKKDKNGHPFLVFSAYSAEKVGQDFVSTWVNFMRFPEKDATIDTITPPFMKPKANVTVKGDFQLSSFNGKVRISSRVIEMNEYIKPEYHPS